MKCSALSVRQRAVAAPATDCTARLTCVLADGVELGLRRQAQAQLNARGRSAAALCRVDVVVMGGPLSRTLTWHTNAKSPSLGLVTSVFRSRRLSPVPASLLSPLTSIAKESRTLGTE